MAALEALGEHGRRIRDIQRAIGAAAAKGPSAAEEVQRLAVERATAAAATSSGVDAVLESLQRVDAQYQHALDVLQRQKRRLEELDAQTVSCVCAVVWCACWCCLMFWLVMFCLMFWRVMFCSRLQLRDDAIKGGVYETGPEPPPPASASSAVYPKLTPLALDPIIIIPDPVSPYLDPPAPPAGAGAGQAEGEGGAAPAGGDDGASSSSSSSSEEEPEPKKKMSSVMRRASMFGAPKVLDKGKGKKKSKKKKKKKKKKKTKAKAPPGPVLVKKSPEQYAAECAAAIAAARAQAEDRVRAAQEAHAAAHAAAVAAAQTAADAVVTRFHRDQAAAAAAKVAQAEAQRDALARYERGPGPDADGRLTGLHLQKVLRDWDANVAAFRKVEAEHTAPVERSLVTMRKTVAARETASRDMAAQVGCGVVWCGVVWCGVDDVSWCAYAVRAMRAVVCRVVCPGVWGGCSWRAGCCCLVLFVSLPPLITACRAPLHCIPLLITHPPTHHPPTTRCYTCPPPPQIQTGWTPRPNLPQLPLLLRHLPPLRDQRLPPRRRMKTRGRTRRVRR